jgi:SAM-dependent methyltransferase
MSDERWRQCQDMLTDWYETGFWKAYPDRPTPWLRHLSWHLEFLLAFYRPPEHPNAKILDVGCGYMAAVLDRLGLYDAILQRLGGDQYTGIDPENDWANDTDIRLKLRGAGSAQVMPGELVHTLDGQFDSIICLGALDHFHDPDMALTGIGKRLTENGRFWLASTVRRDGPPMVDEHHPHQWTILELIRDVEKAGMTIRNTFVSNILKMQKPYFILYIEAQRSEE